MTAEQPSPSHLFPISTLTTTHGDNKVDLIHETKKRKRLLLEEEEELNTSLSPPIEKSPRRDDYQVEVVEEEQTALIDVSRLNHKERLLAYKRIWDNLDLSKPEDAKLEPFVWQKIREYQRNK